ncbi:MAG: TIGR03619 family F420-dependent LLM class oxidoreductase [Solirubrobacterales bacterium]
MKIGVHVPQYRREALEFSITECAARAEEAGFDTIWLIDHNVMPAAYDAPYPYTLDGEPPWDLDAPIYDSVVSMSLVAAATEQVEVGVAVMVPVLRNPVILAKQIASLDAYSGGRIVLGVGAGWLQGEFAALGVPFAARGNRLEEWVEIMRSCWTGVTEATAGPFGLEAGIHCYPRPAREIPIVFGGTNPRALARAGRLGQGYVDVVDTSRDPDSIYSVQMDAETLAAISGHVDAVAAAAAAEGRAGAVGRNVCHCFGTPAQIGAALGELAAVGITELLIHEVEWADPEGPRRALEEVSAGIPPAERGAV